MGRGSPRARGSRAWLLVLLLLRLPLPVRGAEAFQGEWDVPRGAGEVAVWDGGPEPPPLPPRNPHHGGREDRQGLRRTCPGTLSCTWAGLAAQTDTLCRAATVAVAKQWGWGVVPFDQLPRFPNPSARILCLGHPQTPSASVDFPAPPALRRSPLVSRSPCCALRLGDQLQPHAARGLIPYPRALGRCLCVVDIVALFGEVEKAASDRRGPGR